MVLRQLHYAGKVVDNDADSYTWTQDDTYIIPHSGLWTAHEMGNQDDYLITPQFVFKQILLN